MDGRQVDHANGLCLPESSLYECEDSSELSLFGDSIGRYSDEGNSNSESVTEQRPAVTAPQPKPQPIGRENGFDLYPTLQPWGRNNRFTYDRFGQLAANVKLGPEELQEYLYNHPLKDKLIIWIQRHPSKAPLLYNTEYGASCRYKNCAPEGQPANFIRVGHYRIAIDERTGINPKHKADTYIHAAFFHVSCFEEMCDLADLAREFDVRCENRPVVNAPYGEKHKSKNRMLLEERRIPHAVSNWLDKARNNPDWRVTSIEDGMNFLVWSGKFGLRPHRKKNTVVPGLEPGKINADLSHLGAPRPVRPNSIWGGKRVKGITVAEMSMLQGERNEYNGSQASQASYTSLKRKREQSEYVEDTEGDSYTLPEGVLDQTEEYGGSAGNQTPPSSSRTPSPVQFAQPGKLRDDPPRAEPQTPNPPRRTRRRKSSRPTNTTNAGPSEIFIGNFYQPPIQPQAQASMQYNAPYANMGYSNMPLAAPVLYAPMAMSFAAPCAIDPALMTPELNHNRTLANEHLMGWNGSSPSSIFYPTQSHSAYNYPVAENQHQYSFTDDSQQGYDTSYYQYSDPATQLPQSASWMHNDNSMGFETDALPNSTYGTADYSDYYDESAQFDTDALHHRNSPGIANSFQPNTAPTMNYIDPVNSEIDVLFNGFPDVENYESYWNMNSNRG